ncbi:MAG: CatB-related O-acetyltransferase, partial [Acinetobacter junii]
ETDIERLLSLKLYELDEKQILKIRELLQTDQLDGLHSYLDKSL